jgi:hypothetical protein
MRILIPLLALVAGVMARQEFVPDPPDVSIHRKIDVIEVHTDYGVFVHEDKRHTVQKFNDPTIQARSGKTSSLALFFCLFGYLKQTLIFNLI